MSAPPVFTALRPKRTLSAPPEPLVPLPTLMVTMPPRHRPATPEARKSEALLPVLAARATTANTDGHHAAAPGGRDTGTQKSGPLLPVFDVPEQTSVPSRPVFDVPEQDSFRVDGLIELVDWHCAYVCSLEVLYMTIFDGFCDEVMTFCDVFVSYMTNNMTHRRSGKIRPISESW